MSEFLPRKGDKVLLHPAMVTNPRRRIEVGKAGWEFFSVDGEFDVTRITSGMPVFLTAEVDAPEVVVFLSTEIVQSGK